jgi:NADPH-dependent 2,4-dienoyl-CoA reductase/sulfur reductase-like enzyme
MVPDIFHRDFTPAPCWWDAYTPTAGELVDVPHSVRVAIVGVGYAGLSTALELAKHGIEPVVLEADEPRLRRQQPQWRRGQLLLPNIA